MKKKTIKAILKGKFNKWLQSIEDKSVRELVAKNTIITGGCIASMLLREKVNDFDFYFRRMDVVEAIAKYYVGRFQSEKRNGRECAIYVDKSIEGRIRVVVRSAGIASEEGAEKGYEYFESRAEGEAGEYVSEVMDGTEDVEALGDIEDKYEETKEKVRQDDAPAKPPYRPVFLSTNAITLSDKVQIVLRFYGEPDEIHKNYDYVHCTNYWTSWDEELVLHQAALESILAKELRYVGSLYPVCSIFRLRKFIRRGWTINAGQILKAIMQINELDLKDMAVLRDQLTGVDCAYFVEVLGKLKANDPEKVNSAYLVEIIDRMF